MFNLSRTSLSSRTRITMVQSLPSASLNNLIHFPFCSYEPLTIFQALKVDGLSSTLAYRTLPLPSSIDQSLTSQLPPGPSDPPSSFAPVSAHAAISTFVFHASRKAS